MVGSNYMGGKRNTLRSRIKDANGRVEKDHFMRQRYQILTKGLGDHLNAPESRGKALREINFTHAKRDVGASQFDCDVDGSEKSLVSLKSNTVRGAKRTHIASQYETLPKKSKILETIEMNEPLSLKATVDRILRMPDLACLAEVESDRVSSSPKRKTISGTSYNSPIGRRARNIVLGTNEYTAVLDYSSRSSLPRAKSSPHMDHFTEVILPDEQTKFRGPQGRTGENISDFASSSSHITQILSSKWNTPSGAMSRNLSYDDSGFSELFFESDRDVTTSPVHHTYYSNSVLQNNTSCGYKRSSDGISDESSVAYYEASSESSQSKRSLLSNVREQDVSPRSSLFSGSRRSFSSGPSSQLQITQSRNPWLVLDEILDINPLYRSDDDFDPFQHLNTNSRKGLGYHVLTDTHTCRSFPAREEFLPIQIYKQDWSPSSLMEEINIQRTEGQSNGSDSESDNQCMPKSNDNPNKSSCIYSTVNSSQGLSEESEQIRVSSSPVGGNTSANSTRETHAKSSLPASYKQCQQNILDTTALAPSINSLTKSNMMSPVFTDKMMHNFHSVNVSGPNLFDNIFDDTDEY